MNTIKWILASSIVLLTACATSNITSSWIAPQTTLQHFNKILVLGLIRESDRNIQVSMEKHLMGVLRNLGYFALSSYEEYGPKAFNNMNEDEAINKLKNSGIDAVLTIVLLDKEKERLYTGDRIYYSPYAGYYSRFWNYRYTLYHRIVEPGYYVSTKYFWESNLYDMHSQQLIYSVQTESFDPGNAESLGHEYGQLIVNNMLSKNVLAKQLSLP